MLFKGMIDSISMFVKYQHPNIAMFFRTRKGKSRGILSHQLREWGTSCQWHDEFDRNYVTLILFGKLGINSRNKKRNISHECGWNIFSNHLPNRQNSPDVDSVDMCRPFPNGWFLWLFYQHHTYFFGRPPWQFRKRCFHGHLDEIPCVWKVDDPVLSSFAMGQNWPKIWMVITQHMQTSVVPHESIWKWRT